MAPTSPRRTLVNLSVVAGSAAMFAAAWAGIARADGDQYAQAGVPATTAMAVAPVQPTGAPAMNVVPTVNAGADPTTTPAPRRAVVVRQSRAS